MYPIAERAQKKLEGTQGAREDNLYLTARAGWAHVLRCVGRSPLCESAFASYNNKNNQDQIKHEHLSIFCVFLRIAKVETLRQASTVSTANILRI